MNTLTTTTTTEDQNAFWQWVSQDLTILAKLIDFTHTRGHGVLIEMVKFDPIHFDIFPCDPFKRPILIDTNTPGHKRALFTQGYKKAKTKGPLLAQRLLQSSENIKFLEVCVHSEFCRINTSSTVKNMFINRTVSMKSETAKEAFLVSLDPFL